MQIELSAYDLREILQWAEDTESEGGRPDYEVIQKLKSALDDLEPEEPDCVCCEMKCCGDPEHCCQNHTCGRVNDLRSFYERY